MLFCGSMGGETLLKAYGSNYSNINKSRYKTSSGMRQSSKICGLDGLDLYQFDEVVIGL